MRARLVALVLGIVYLLVGVAGFVAFIAPPAPPDAQVISLTTAYAWLLGIFPVNAALDVVHIAVGLAGIACAVSLPLARAYLRTMFVFFCILTVLGAIGITSTLLGVAPIYGWDVALDAATALCALISAWGPLSRAQAI
jgi:hypothetical protein